MFHEGDLCLVRGLKSKPSWNGREAKVVGAFQWHQARYPVEILGDDDDDNKEQISLNALLKPANLKLVSRCPTRNPQPPLCRVQFIDKERGFGVFATRDIRAGTVILEETAILVLPKQEHRAKGETEEQCIRRQFEALSLSQQQQVTALHDNLNEDSDCVGVYRTNAYMFTDDERHASGLFPRISRLNHCCLPNAQLVDDPERGANAVIALLGIGAGEQITHSYAALELLMCARAERGAYLRDNFGFDCACRECTRFAPRDAFRAEYRALATALERAFEDESADKLMQCAVGMTRIVRERFKGYPPLLSQALMHVAEAHLCAQRYEQVLKCKGIHIILRLDESDRSFLRVVVFCV